MTNICINRCFNSGRKKEDTIFLAFKKIFQHVFPSLQFLHTTILTLTYKNTVSVLEGRKYSVIVYALCG